MSHQENITRIKAVYHALEELANDVVFVGGATVSLYATRPGKGSRVTDDVDVVIELLNYNDYAALEDKLREKGFRNDTFSGVLCRFVIDGIIVDFMPTSVNVLGFSNKWYPEAFKNSIKTSVGTNIDVRIFSAPYFLASKLEAFADRGKNDGRFSSDFEDIVQVLNNRESIWEEIREVNLSAKDYLKITFKNLLNEKYIGEWISSHLDYEEQSRGRYIIARLMEFISND